MSLITALIYIKATDLTWNSVDKIGNKHGNIKKNVWKVIHFAIPNAGLDSHRL